MRDVARAYAHAVDILIRKHIFEPAVRLGYPVAPGKRLRPLNVAVEHCRDLRFAAFQERRYLVIPRYRAGSDDGYMYFIFVHGYLRSFTHRGSHFAEYLADFHRAILFDGSQHRKAHSEAAYIVENRRHAARLSPELALDVLKHTRVGLHLRAVGESPNTADAAGIDVKKYKYIATCVGSMIAGLGGLYYVMDYACGIWSNDAFGDRGWLAIALVIFTIWKPDVGVISSILFGGLYILYLFLPTGTNLAVKELYKMIPYVVTIVVLVISSMRDKRENQPPASLGLAYFREER